MFVSDFFHEPSKLCYIPLEMVGFYNLPSQEEYFSSIIFGVGD